jgi:HEPN domain-containing protein
MANRADDWLRQSESDLLWTKDTLKMGHWAQCCFVAQQTAEKAIKALALHRGVDSVKSHSVSARYPDAFPSGAPFEYFTEDQAVEAHTFAERIIAIVRAKMVTHG